MKRLMVLLAGFGVILLAGCWENSLAEEVDSLFARYTRSRDSSRVLSLRERAEKNFAYMKPGPAHPGKVAGEFLAGAIGGAVCGALGARVGWDLTYVEHESEGWLDFNFSGLPGAIAGYFILSNLGCAAGVSLVGNTGGEEGSYWASFGGSVAGTFLGGLLAAGIVAASEDGLGGAPFLVLPLAQAGGAAMGFNATRKKKVEVSGGALLNLQEGGMSLAFPQVSVSHDPSSSGDYKVNLFVAKF